MVSSGGTVGDTVGLGVGRGAAEGVAVDVADGVTRGVGSGEAVPDGELPPLGGIPVLDGMSGTRAGAGRNPTGGVTSRGGPELASSASSCSGKGCRTLPDRPMSVPVVVAGCSGTLSFDWRPMIATIATTAKQQPTTAISLASSVSRPTSPRCLSVREAKKFWTVTRPVTISATRFR